MKSFVKKIKRKKLDEKYNNDITLTVIVSQDITCVSLSYMEHIIFKILSEQKYISTILFDGSQPPESAIFSCICIGNMFMSIFYRFSNSSNKKQTP